MKKTVGEKAFKKSFFPNRWLWLFDTWGYSDLEATLWFEHLCCGLLSPEAEAWMEKTGGMKFEAGEVPSAPCVGSRGTGTGWLVRNQTFPSWTHSWNQRQLQVGIAGDFFWGSLLNPHGTGVWGNHRNALRVVNGGHLVPFHWGCGW